MLWRWRYYRARRRLERLATAYRPRGTPDVRREALAREIVARRTGMPAYLASDEDWDAAEAEAQAAELPPEPPESDLQRAIRLARGDLRTEEEFAQQIGYLNRVSAAISAAVKADDGHGA